MRSRAASSPWPARHRSAWAYTIAPLSEVLATTGLGREQLLALSGFEFLIRQFADGRREEAVRFRVEFVAELRDRACVEEGRRA